MNPTRPQIPTTFEPGSSLPDPILVSEGIVRVALRGHTTTSLLAYRHTLRHRPPAITGRYSEIDSALVIRVVEEMIEDRFAAER